MLDDFNLFDIEEHKWLRTRVIQNGKEIVSDSAYGTTIDTEDSDFPKVNQIGARKDHSIVSVYDQFAHMISARQEGQNNRRMALGNKDRARRAMWIHERTFTREETTIGKEYKEGFYMFGGVNREEEKLNDLWLIRPEYYTNKRMIDDFKF